MDLHRHKKLSWLGVCILAGAVSCKQAAPANQPEPQQPTKFVLIPPDQTGVHFENTLVEGLNTNILMYEYFYNGGGVACGDFNGDELIDLYFTSNMGENKLFLNQGDWKFQDVTTAAGMAGRPGPWKTGTAAVDINGDGRLDLYLCYSGALPPVKRTNQLFINHGNDAAGIPIFREEAHKYGLDSPAFSNQGYFFDYDRDGDLDMLLLNHNPKSLPVLNERSTAEFLKQDDPLRGVRLYQQEQGTFRDITTSSGISGSGLTYGLGIGISDLNNDGWQDFYVSNDYAVPDYLYINNGDGTFTDQLASRLGQTSHFSMGNDIADINNDGWQDIYTLDMLPEDNRRQKLLLAPDNYEKFDLNLRSGFHYQYMRNMLQLNTGNGAFQEIGQQAGISNTDWSWAALLADFDNDGWKDLFVTNGYFRDYTNLDFINYMDNYVQSKGRLKREDVLEVIKQMPSSDVSNYMFANVQGQSFYNTTRDWGLQQPANSNGAAYADLDNDGDLDLVVNNINRPAFIYRNDTRKAPDSHYLQVKLMGLPKNTLGLGARVTLYTGSQQQNQVQSISRGYLSSVSPVLHFGLGSVSRVDSISVIWNSGRRQTLYQIKADTSLVLREKDAISETITRTTPTVLFHEIDPNFDYHDPAHQTNDFKRQPLLISQLSFSSPVMIKADTDSDGLEDLVIGGAKGHNAVLFRQQAPGDFELHPVQDFIMDRESEDSDLAVFDANGDGLQDIYIASGGYHDFLPDDSRLQDRLYLNNGKGNFLKSTDALPKMYSSTGCIAVNDINKDGHPDVFVGGRVIPGSYPEAPESYMLINDGNARFHDELAPMSEELKHFGMITDALWSDLDNNGTSELIVVGEWLPVSVFSIQNGVFKNVTTKYFDRPYRGWWNTVKEADLNRDGKPDLVVGNMGTNTQFKVSPQEPAELYFSDFDANGSIDPIFCFYIQGQSYPYVTRDELLRQLVHLRSKYTSYESFAGATMEQIFGQRELANAHKLQADHMATSLFLSDGQSGYRLVELPYQAQYSPVYAIEIQDFNLDGHPDILLLGNNHHFKLRLGKFDANHGTLLLNDGQGGFYYVDQVTSGLSILGEVRSTVTIGNTLLVGRNQEKIKAYQWSALKRITTH